MVLSMKVNTFKVKNMELVDSHGLMDLLTMVSLSKITFKVKVNITGLTEGNMTVYG